VATIPLLEHLAIALAAALAGALVATALRQSPILGYLLAGMAMAPTTPGFVADVAAVEALAEIGIVFLMFAVGVQFPRGMLLRAGRVAIAGGLVQVGLVILAGYGMARALGLPPMEAFVIGAVLSNSSSTVLSKLLAERNEAETPEARLGLAWSSVQDLSTIVLVVTMTTLAAGGEGMLAAVAWSLAKAAVLLLLLGPGGSRGLSRIFEWLAAVHSRELFVVAVATLALGTAYVASLLGLSIALGAFVAGVAVGESDLSHRILGEAVPLRDIFAGLFFVSVGLLVEPAFARSHPALVAAMTALIVGLKGILVVVLAAVFGISPRVAVLVGTGLAQCGEFSFLMARLGLELGIVRPTTFSLLLSAATASILLSPIVYRLGLAVVPLVERLVAREDSSSPDAEVSPPVTDAAGHAILCGHGRVGQQIARILRLMGIPFVVIDRDARVVRTLRAAGIPALVGDAGSPVALERARLAAARLLAVALPDPLTARQIVDHARRVAPALDIVARTHSEAEQARLHRLGATEVVMGETELAFEMSRHTLRAFGVPLTEVEAVLDRERLQRMSSRAQRDDAGP